MLKLFSDRSITRNLATSDAGLVRVARWCVSYSRHKREILVEVILPKQTDVTELVLEYHWHSISEVFAKRAKASRGKDKKASRARANRDKGNKARGNKARGRASRDNGQTEVAETPAADRLPAAGPAIAGPETLRSTRATYGSGKENSASAARRPRNCSGC